MIDELYKLIENGAKLNDLYVFLRDNKHKFSKEEEELISLCPKSAISICNLISILVDENERNKASKEE